MAARALSPAPLPFRQSSQVVARGIKASDVIARAPPFNPGGSNERTGTPHRTSSAAVIFAVTAPAGPAGKLGNSELSPSPSPRIFAPLPASRWRHAWRRHCSARLDHPLVSPCAAQTASHPGRPHSTPPRPAAALQAASDDVTTASCSLSDDRQEKKAAPSHEGKSGNGPWP